MSAESSLAAPCDALPNSKVSKSTYSGFCQQQTHILELVERNRSAYARCWITCDVNRKQCIRGNTTEHVMAGKDYILLLLLNACVRVADVMIFTVVSLMPVHNVCRICMIINKTVSLKYII